MTISTISFVVVEFLSIDDIRVCVESIKDVCRNVSCEIIVSSNSCYSIERQKELAKMFPSVKWMFNPRNGGFAYAMNQGLKKTNGKYLTIINPDVRIKTDLDRMVQFMEDHPHIGAIAPQIVNEKGEIQDSCRPYVSIQNYIGRTIKRIYGHKSSVLTLNMDYSKIQTVDWVIGAFIMVRNEVYYKTNGLDEYYFMYAEDLDWCTRIRKCGYEVVYFPSAQVIYEGSRSARKSAKYAKIFLRSHIHYWKKFGFMFGYPKRDSKYLLYSP